MKCCTEKIMKLNYVLRFKLNADILQFLAPFVLNALKHFPFWGNFAHFMKKQSEGMISNFTHNLPARHTTNCAQVLKKNIFSLFMSKHPN
jgi:hypothetical protein